MKNEIMSQRLRTAAESFAEALRRGETDDLSSLEGPVMIIFGEDSVTVQTGEDAMILESLLAEYAEVLKKAEAERDEAAAEIREIKELKASYGCEIDSQGYWCWRAHCADVKQAEAVAANVVMADALKPALTLLQDEKPGPDDVLMPEDYNIWCDIIAGLEAALASRTPAAARYQEIVHVAEETTAAEDASGAIDASLPPEGEECSAEDMKRTEESYARTARAHEAHRKAVRAKGGVADAWMGADHLP